MASSLRIIHVSQALLAERAGREPAEVRARRARAALAPPSLPAPSPSPSSSSSSPSSPSSPTRTALSLAAGRPIGHWARAAAAPSRSRAPSGRAPPKGAELARAPPSSPALIIRLGLFKNVRRRLPRHADDIWCPARQAKGQTALSGSSALVQYERATCQRPAAFRPETYKN
jgi:hypothetical protein